MKLSRLSRRSIAVLSFSAAVAVGLAIVVAKVAASTSFVPTWTGCYNPSGGTINKLQQGAVPLRTCVAPSFPVMVSSGDITSISVGGGLTGGGDNGDITITLDAKYSLPQACMTGGIPKWNGTAWECGVDHDTTYSAGTGLSLTSSIFSIVPGFRLPQGCQSGQVAVSNGSDSWTCANQPAAPIAHSATSGIGAVLDDGKFYGFGTVNITEAGLYLVIGKGTIESDENVQDFKSVTCSLQPGPVGTAIDSTSLGSVVLDDVPEIPISLVGQVSFTSPGTMTLGCSASPGADGIQFEDARIVVVKLQ
jgi:hypothetical protein